MILVAEELYRVGQSKCMIVGLVVAEKELVDLEKDEVQHFLVG
jgi:hypothetical protein